MKTALNVRIEEKNLDQLVKFSKEQNITISQSVREILGSFFIVNPPKSPLPAKK